MNQPNSDSSGRWFLLAIVGVFILGGLGVAVAVNKGGANDIDNLPSVASVEIEGAPLPLMAEAGANILTAETDPAFGMVAPTLVGTDFSGEDVTITADGRPKVLFFLAHWCPHCQREVPQVVSLDKEGLKPEGVDFYAISTSYDATLGNPPARWLDKEEWPFPAMRDSQNSEAFVSYGAGGFPYAVYLDGDNKVLFRTSGELTREMSVQFWNETAASVDTSKS